jgi:PAS domain S-box-containing protein
MRTPSPILHPEVGRPQEAALSGEGTNRPRILFVEDDATLRELLASTLADEYVVDIAGDGEQALRCILKARPEVIVTDILMPGIDGIELVRMLRSAPGTETIPILLTSGQAPEDIRIAGFELGADAYLAKPYTVRELRARIRAMVQAVRTRGENARREATALAERQAIAERAALLDSITDGFFALDRHWRFTYVNQVALEYLKGSREQLLGRSIWEAFPTMVGSTFHREYQRAVLEQRPVEFEAESAYSQRWIDVHAYPTPQGLAVTFRDITDRKRIEESLRESEERYRAFVVNSSEAIWRYELDEPLDLSLPLDEQVEHVYRHARVAEANDALARTYGKSRAAELVGRPIAKMLSFDPAVARAHLRELAAAGFSVTNAESQQHTVDGRALHFSSSLVPVIENGKLLRVWGTQRDITERKEVEFLLLENERRKDEFLAVLAHELRNPLAPVRNGLQILRLRAGADSILQNTVAMMDRQMTHLVRLVDDLLDVSRITRGKLELRRQNVLLSDALASAIEATNALIEAKDHRLIVDVPAETVVVYGDPNRLAQVFSNLLSNSAKYTNRGGEITVSLRRVDARAMVTVKDSGIGIAPDTLGTVFEMFSQGNPQHARAEGGLGIGLALVRMLVERHEGTVEAFSDGPNEGSIFTVSLPVAAVGIDMSHDVAATSRFAGSSAKRVLVVDDNVDAAASLMMLLQMGGHDVRSASDGVEAVDIASTFSPQIIFMDLGMPRMDGLEASRRIRALENGRSILIVALTGWGQEADRKRTRNAGIDHHLVKPVSIQELEHVLEMVERR